MPTFQSCQQHLLLRERPKRLPCLINTTAQLDSDATAEVPHLRVTSISKQIRASRKLLANYFRQADISLPIYAHAFERQD